MTAFVADDEPLARKALRDLVESEAGLQLVGVATDGRQAVEGIDSLRPDVVFLDIQMPELSGLEVLRRVEHRPVIVFTTAFDAHAVTAFELGAVDYLLKPFGLERFREAVRRARKLVHDGGAASEFDRAREVLRTEEPLRRLFLPQGERVVPVGASDIVRVEGSGDYVRVHVTGSSYLAHVTLAHLERRLDGTRFLRVHRSHIVNLDFITELRREDDRRLRLQMRDGSHVVASRSGTARLRAMF